MKPLAKLLVAAAALVAGSVFAVTPAQEKAFVDAYRSAFVKKDGKALHALLYTVGADPMAIEMYQMMMAADFGAKLTELRLAELTADDLRRLADSKAPDGRTMVMPLKPVRKLIIKTAQQSANGSSTSSSESFVAEHAGRLVIPVPSAK